MLTFDQVKKYYPSQAQLFSKSIIVEYLQYELLDSIYKQPGSTYLSFIGGTSIRILYQGQRFSEDLDFDNFGLSFHDFTELTSDVIDDMKLKGFDIEFRLIEKGAYHCYIKFPHLLYQNKISQHAREKILVRLDTVRKKKIYTPEIHTLNRFDIYRDILTAPADIVLSQKLITILQRKRERGRDLYDVSFLYGLTKPNYVFIEKSTGMNRQELQNKLIQKCETLDFHYLAQDVQPFLIDPTQTRRIQQFQRFIAEQFSAIN